FCQVLQGIHRIGDRCGGLRPEALFQGDERVRPPHFHAPFVHDRPVERVVLHPLPPDDLEGIDARSRGHSGLLGDNQNVPRYIAVLFSSVHTVTARRMMTTTCPNAGAGPVRPSSVLWAMSLCVPNLLVQRPSVIWRAA